MNRKKKKMRINLKIEQSSISQQNRNADCIGCANGILKQQSGKGLRMRVGVRFVQNHDVGVRT